MKIFITGATGYLGQIITQELIQKGIEVVILIRKGSEKKLKLFKKQPKFIIRNILENNFSLKGFDLIIHLVAIIREVLDKNITFRRLNYESVKNMINIALRDKVPRFIYMSSIKPPFSLFKEYYRYKLMAENELKNSSLKWIIFKPSLIYSNSFLGKSMGWIKLIKYPLEIIFNFPIFRSKIKIFKPISRHQLARGIFNSLENDIYFYKIFEGESLFQLCSKIK